MEEARCKKCGAELIPDPLAPGYWFCSPCDLADDAEPDLSPLGHDGGWIDSADMGEDAPDDPSLPDRYR